MSRVTMSAAGSWGDVLLFVAVAHGMRARGHDVEFVVPRGGRKAVAHQTALTNEDGVAATCDALESMLT